MRQLAIAAPRLIRMKSPRVRKDAFLLAGIDSPNTDLANPQEAVRTNIPPMNTCKASLSFAIVYLPLFDLFLPETQSAIHS